MLNPYNAVVPGPVVATQSVTAPPYVPCAGACKYGRCIQVRWRLLMHISAATAFRFALS